MRITCPNCAAQYEVPPEAIPPEGREVQCSACGHGWTEMAPDTGGETDAETGSVAPDGRSLAAPAEDPAPQAGAAAGMSGPPPAPPRRDLDSSVREVLRAEAEREAKAREAEAAARRAARQEAAPGDRAPGARDGTARKRLPDIEEVDSALAPAPAAPDPQEALPAEAEAGRRGFRLGFFAVVGLAALALGVYLLARGMENPPAALAAYVEAFDRSHHALAEGLDALMRRLTELIVSDPA